MFLFKSKSNVSLLLDLLFTLFELLHVDQLASGCIDFLHLLNLRLEVLLFRPFPHHLILSLPARLLFEVLFEVGWNGLWVFHVPPLHERPKHLLLAHDAISKSIELRSAIINLLVHGLGFVHQVLAVREVAPDFLANHHRQLIYGQLCRRSIVPPVVVISAANRVQLVRVLVFDHLGTNLLTNLFITKTGRMPESIILL